MISTYLAGLIYHHQEAKSFVPKEKVSSDLNICFLKHVLTCSLGVFALSVIHELLLINCHDSPKSLRDGVRGFRPLDLKKINLKPPAVTLHTLKLAA